MSPKPSARGNRDAPTVTTFAPTQLLMTEGKGVAASPRRGARINVVFLGFSVEPPKYNVFGCNSGG